MAMDKCRNRSPRIAFADADFVWRFVQGLLSLTEILDTSREYYGWLYVISMTWRSFPCRQNDIPSSGSDVSPSAMGKGHGQGLVWEVCGAEGRGFMSMPYNERRMVFVISNSTKRGERLSVPFRRDSARVCFGTMSVMLLPNTMVEVSPAAPSTYSHSC